MKRAVRLKLLTIFTLLATVLHVANAAAVPSTRTSTVPDHRDIRLAAENAEKQWVSSLARRASEYALNGTVHVKADVYTEPGMNESMTTEAPKPALPTISIECATFDEVECATHGRCELGKKTCHTENHLRAVGCIAIFGWPARLESNRTEDFFEVPLHRFKKLDCMQYQDTSSMSCVSATKCRQENRFRAGIGMCCCTTPNCNVLGNIEQVNPSKKDYFLDGSTPPTSHRDYDQDATSRVYWYIVTALALILWIALGVLGYTAWKKMRKRNSASNRNRSKMDSTNAMETGHQTPLVDHDMFEMVETPKELPITDFLLISKGRFGTVYRGKWTEKGVSKLVAVKKLAVNERKNFEDEKRIFDALTDLPRWYQSIVKFICAEKVGNEYWIVTEFHERLSLNEMITHNELSISSANRILLTMLDGLQFLHDERPYYFGHQKPSIIHRDIKSKNILVKKDMTACIADFGLARIYNFDISRSDILGQVGTRRYMSPEMLEGATEFTPTAFKAMDVYSMALVMWEVISRTRVSFDDKVPEYEAPYNHLGFNPPVGSMRSHVVQKKERPPWRQEHLEHEHVKELIKIVEWMWEPEAYARITAGCAFSKTWTAVQNAAECSEGYHSGGSTKDMEKVLLAGVENEKKEANILKPEDIGEMVRYHEFPYDKPHPSANPFKDVCPSPPTIPDLSDLLALGVLQSEPQEEQGRADDLAPSEEEQVFDMTTNRLLTDDEKVRVEHTDVVQSVTRASTPTPSGSI